jgi:hypothetical protein
MSQESRVGSGEWFTTSIIVNYRRLFDSRLQTLDSRLTSISRNFHTQTFLWLIKMLLFN